MSLRETQLKQEKNESIQIGTLFKFIKPFDGSREKLNSFITNCDNAIELASDAQKSILFKFILSQLEGKAEVACSIKEFDSWDQLSHFLKTQFGERKHYAHLMTELQECRQSNEPVNQYALRVETCLSKLLTEVTLSNKKKTELVGRTAAMEDLALHTFLIGLKPDISNLVRGRNPSTLNDAINFAVSEEKIINSYNRRNPHSSTSHRTFPKPQYNFHSPDHNAISRPQVQKQYDRNNQNLFCRYCKKSGHTIEICRKREYNNNRFKSNPPPQFQRQSNQDSFRPQPARVNCVVNREDYYNIEGQPSTSSNDAQPQVEYNHLNE